MNNSAQCSDPTPETRQQEVNINKNNTWILSSSPVWSPHKTRGHKQTPEAKWSWIWDSVTLPSFPIGFVG